MGKYQVQTFDGKSDDPKPVEMELTQPIQVRTSQGTAICPLPADEGGLIQVVFVEPVAKAPESVVEETEEEPKKTTKK